MVPPACEKMYLTFDVRAKRLLVKHLCHRARRIRGEVDERVRQPEAVGHRIGRSIGVHEHSCRSSLKLGEYRLEEWISKVNPLDVREQEHAVEFEDIEGVAQFVQPAVDVG